MSENIRAKDGLEAEMLREATILSRECGGTVEERLEQICKAHDPVNSLNNLLRSLREKRTPEMVNKGLDSIVESRVILGHGEDLASSLNG